MIISIDVEILAHAKGLSLPEYKTPGSSGMDVLAAVGEDVEIAPGRILLVPTGLKVAAPEGFELQVRPRSGLALKHGLFVINSPGTIDSDYRGELQVILANFGPEPFCIRRGMRIAQLVLARVERIAWNRVEELSSTERSGGGFGHTGV
ncbi:dUTP diphosphatase [Candidatus Sumerlaeota bacterium]|nr:dUTP diphosphatase [Candidatus Sumerlaeota bacterium]